MPCWEINTTSVALDVADIDLLEKALVAEGFSVYYKANGRIGASQRKGRVVVQTSYENGRLTLECPKSQSREDIAAVVNAVKRGYAREAVLMATSKFGWKLKQDAKNKNKFQATRRSF